jgi:Porphobilinogen deaminase
LISFEPDPKQFIPAPGQGLIAIQNRDKDTHITDLISSILDQEIHRIGSQYFTLLNGIAFNCEHPFGAYIDQGNLHVFCDTHEKKFHTFYLGDLENAIRLIKDKT